MNLTITHPELAREYSPKNQLPPSQVLAGTTKLLWWICAKCSHEWQTTGNDRTHKNPRPSGCPACSGRVATPKKNLAITHPHLIGEYSDCNALPPTEVVAGTNKKLLWRCAKCSYEWEAIGSSRASGHGCPACRHLVVTSTNNLAVTHPNLAEEYSPRNELPATQVVAGTGKRLWWRCRACDHEWRNTGSNRVNGSGCQACAGKVVSSTNNLATKYPNLATEYSHRNLLPATQVLPDTNKKLLWVCKEGHGEWSARGNRRAKNNAGCPRCKWKKGWNTRRNNKKRT